MVTVLAISFLIFFHELGHFLAARALGVGVNVFSVGFGEKVFTKRIGATQYAISAIPLGGYVSLKGQEDLDPAAASADPDSYNSKGPIARIIILFAGPFFNLHRAGLHRRRKARAQGRQNFAKFRRSKRRANAKR